MDRSADDLGQILNNIERDLEELKTTQIRTENIPDGAITTPKIADEAVTEGKVADGAISTNKIEDSAVTGSKIDWATTGLNYSTTETNTGLTWTDGKTIYRKTFVKQISSIPSGDTSYAHNVSGFSQLISFSSTFNLGWDTNTWATDTFLVQNGIRFRVNKTNVLMENTGSSLSWTGTLTYTIEYTKS